MTDQLETERTLLRPFRSADAVAAFEWFSDPDVMRYISFGPDTTVEQTSKRISRYIDHQTTHGFSKWIMLDRYSETPIGDAGFFLLPDGNRVELGYITSLLESRLGYGGSRQVVKCGKEVVWLCYGLCLCPS